MRTSPTLFTFAAILALALPAGAVDPTGRDPFSAYPDDVIRCFDAPIQRVPIAALKVQGFVAGIPSPRALILHPDGTSHLVKVGTPIGNNLGQVAAITPGGVTVEEHFRDAFGARHRVRTLLSGR